MTETHTPLPCPFCGGPAEKYESAMAQIYSFGCADENECASAPSSGTFPTEAEALTAWNTRAVNRHQAERETLARMEWRGIESAPKDGTPLLLFARSVRAIAPVRVVGWYIEGSGWLECAFSPNTPVGLVPSAWQPLPDMPARFDDALPPAPEAGQ